MILTVTLNPAVDKTYRTEELFCGRSKILRQYDCEVTATGFLGGFPGRWIESELRRAGMKCEFIKIGQETRSSMNVVADNGYVTEILEPGPQIAEAEMEEFLERFDRLLPGSSIVVLSGSVPQGVPEDIYAELIRRAQAQGKETILDTSGELLRKGIEAAPTAIKPNRREMEYVIGHKLNGRDGLLEAAAFLRRNGVHMAAVSLGSKGLLMAGEEGLFYAKPPRVKTLNTVGCGDCVVASMVMSRTAGLGRCCGARWPCPLRAPLLWKAEAFRRSLPQDCMKRLRWKGCSCPCKKMHNSAEYEEALPRLSGIRILREKRFFVSYFL